MEEGKLSEKERIELFGRKAIEYNWLEEANKKLTYVKCVKKRSWIFWKVLGYIGLFILIITAILLLARNNPSIIKLVGNSSIIK